MRKGFVYILSYGEDIFYVGSTTNLAVRSYQHEKNVKTVDSPLYRHIRSIGTFPLMECIEDVFFENISSLREEEKYWIEQFRQWGYKLKNVSDNIGVKRSRTIYKSHVSTSDKMLTGKDVQMILQISRVTLWKLCKDGFIKSYQVGGQNRYKRSDIEKMMK